MLPPNVQAQQGTVVADELSGNSVFGSLISGQTRLRASLSLSHAGPRHTREPKSNVPSLVIGGTGSLGQLSAEFLALSEPENGVVVVGRNSSSLQRNPASVTRLSLAISGPIVLWQAAISSDLYQMLQCTPGTRLGNVLHAAGASTDSALELQTLRHLREASSAKRLTALTQPLGMDTHTGPLLLFSSIAGALGSPGQFGYAAANGALDALAAKLTDQVWNWVGKRTCLLPEFDRLHLPDFAINFCTHMRVGSGDKKHRLGRLGGGRDGRQRSSPTQLEPAGHSAHPAFSWIEDAGVRAAGRDALPCGSCLSTHFVADCCASVAASGAIVLRCGPARQDGLHRGCS